MDDPNAAGPAAAEGSPQQVQNLGETTRIVPATEGEHNPSLQQTADEQAAAEAAKTAGTPTPKPGEAAAETPEAKAAREAAAKEAPAPVDFKGTVFEGLSPEMQGKIAPFAAAYAENGTLTEAEVTEAAKATGFSEAAVKQFMAGAGATAANEAKPLFDTFGGDAQFREFQTWTQQDGSLTAGEAKVINKALGLNPDGAPDPKLTPDYEMAAELMKGPMERWKAAGGGPAARDVTNAPQGPTGQDSGDVYESWAQLTKDQGSPAYRDDPAFRAKVEAKIARSPALG